MNRPKIDQQDNITFFQQKWKAKGMLRDYHGEHVVERKWVRMFSRRLLSVAEMDTKYMAEHDGSELAAGRGSGKDEQPNWSHDMVPKRIMTPYMQMTFAPMERRLDIAVFRAMFASSTRQARQFCVHGAVKVNGKVVSSYPFQMYHITLYESTLLTNNCYPLDALPSLPSQSRRYVPSRSRARALRDRRTESRI